MSHPGLHEHLAAVAPRALGGGFSRTPPAAMEVADVELAEAEAQADAGCSYCARALVNAREASIELATVALPPSPRASASLRDRILRSAREARRPVPARSPRQFDPSGEVARRHIGAPGDAERTAEVDALRALELGPGDASELFLAQLERLIGFPLLFVSVVRGERVGYRVQRGLDAATLETPQALASIKDRRRETTFCTHAVSGEAPLIIPNAGAEPFFRGSNMVARYHVKSYVGVPLRTSRGVTIGTVCAMDFRPRTIDAATLRAVELFVDPIGREIEAPRTPEQRVPRGPSAVPIHDEAWFGELCAVSRALSESRGRRSWLVVAEGPGAEAIAALAEISEPVGRLPGGGVGLSRAFGPEPRLDELRARLSRALGPLGSAGGERVPRLTVIPAT